MNKQAISIEGYDNPSWSHKQAHINGQKLELAWLEKLLEVVD